MRLKTRFLILGLGAVGVWPQSAMAKDILFWNLTAHTITDFRLSPPSANAWGDNQALNDHDKSVDHDERLRITGIQAGTFDAQFTDTTGRTCIVRNVVIKGGGVFSINEKQATDCHRKN